MLWDLVYDFFVKYIFGGFSSDGTLYSATLGQGYDFDMDDLYPYQTGDFWIFKLDNQNVYMSFGNYLSLIATIVSMVAIVLICCALIKKIYNMCAHIIG